MPKKDLKKYINEFVKVHYLPKSRTKDIAEEEIKNFQMLKPTIVRYVLEVERNDISLYKMATTTMRCCLWYGIL